MTENTARTPVSSHTEYARGRIRCPRCGEYVTVNRGARDGLCANCVS